MPMTSSNATTTAAQIQAPVWCGPSSKSSTVPTIGRCTGGTALDAAMNCVRSASVSTDSAWTGWSASARCRSARISAADW